jgi:hypothetical protein
MKKVIFLLFGACFIGQNLEAQLGKLKLPKELPKELPKTGGNSGSGNSGGTAAKAGLGGSDASGLFSNVGNDPSANVHRKGAVENLNALEAEFAKPAPDYTNIGKLIKDTNQRLSSVKQLESGCNTSKFEEKYKPLKERADKELVAYERLKVLDNSFFHKFSAPTEFRQPQPSPSAACYCRNYSSNQKTQTEYETDKAEYASLLKAVSGYKNETTERVFANMATCQKNGNQYAVWASKENLNKELVEFSAQKQTASPKEVIGKCETYVKSLERIEADYSLILEAATKTALAEGKTNANKVKADAELYISSGKYQIYLDKEHKAAIAKVMMPKAVNKNPTLEKGAMDYIKSDEFTEYVKSSVGEIASATRSVMLTKDTKVAKNDIGIPKYEFHEFVVAFKGKDGKCYKTFVYASYTYKGGGTFAKEPTFSADFPTEMACENVNK